MGYLGFGALKNRLTEISQEKWLVARKVPHKDTGNAENMRLRSFWVQAGLSPCHGGFALSCDWPACDTPFCSSSIPACTGPAGLHWSSWHHSFSWAPLRAAPGPHTGREQLGSTSWGPPHCQIAAGRQAALGGTPLLPGPAGMGPGSQGYLTGGATPGVLRSCTHTLT